MLKVGPDDDGDGPIPAGSIIVCWGCRSPLFISRNGIFDDTNVDDDELIDIKSSKRIIVPINFQEMTCRQCGEDLYKKKGQVTYFAPPETLGARMCLFMIEEDMA